MPRALIFSSGEDTGGVGIATKEAFDRLEPNWEIRSARSTDNWIHYPTDLDWVPGAQNVEIEAIYQNSDVLHMMLKFEIADMFPGGRDKPRIIHHHGRLFRNNPEPFIERGQREGVPGVTSTIDLYLLAPDELTWVPNPVDIRGLERWREEHYRDQPDRLRIAHAPTIRSGKSTEAFLRACERLSKEIRVEVILIENHPWHACLMMKAQADIYYDQVLVGYGNNAIEAWAMGIPVVAGAASAAEGLRKGIRTSDGILDEMERRFGYLPFVPSTEDTIYEALRVLANDKIRGQYGELGHVHAAKWHDGRKTVAALKEVYARVL